MFAHNVFGNLQQSYLNQAEMKIFYADEPQECDDPNRETKPDGSCASSCKEGFDWESPKDDAPCTPATTSKRLEAWKWVLIPVAIVCGVLLLRGE
jgi:hypothetical protein